MRTRYHVCGIGYDNDNHVTDYERDFGDFDTYEEAYEHFVKLQCRDKKSFFSDYPDLPQLLIQLEECEEYGDEINCVDVKNEWIINDPEYQ